MIKALAHDQKGDPIIFLSITDKNVEKLTEGYPIHVDMGELDNPGRELAGRVIILYGKDEEALRGQLIGPETSVGKVIKDKPLSLREELVEATSALLAFLDGGLEPDGIVVERVREALVDIR